MDYKKKIAYAEKVADKLAEGVHKEEIKNDLLAENLYEKDVANIFRSAENVLQERLGKEIKARLIKDWPKDISPDYPQIDKDTLMKIIKKEIGTLSNEQKQKVKKMIREKKSREEIHAAVDKRFYPDQYIDMQLEVSKKVASMNSAPNRIWNIVAGVALILVGGIGTLFAWQAGYVVALTIAIMIWGFGLIAKGLTTVDNPFG